VAEYDHSLGCSITGGYVYRGAAHLALLGRYVFGDYCSGRLWTLERDPEGHWTMTERVQTDLRISSFGEDEAGELYLTDDRSGNLYRLHAVPAE
jgi:hypothetical protein